MDDYISREEYPEFHQGMLELANQCVGRNDPVSKRRLVGCLEVLDWYCARCGARLRKYRARRCRRCWAEQPWARN